MHQLNLLPKTKISRLWQNQSIIHCYYTSYVIEIPWLTTLYSLAFRPQIKLLFKVLHIVYDPWPKTQCKKNSIFPSLTYVEMLSQKIIENQIFGRYIDATFIVQNSQQFNNLIKVALIMT